MATAMPHPEPTQARCGRKTNDPTPTPAPITRHPASRVEWHSHQPTRCANLIYRRRDSARTGDSVQLRPGEVTIDRQRKLGARDPGGGMSHLTLRDRPSPGATHTSAQLRAS